jgi:hypothetical protein
MKKKAIRGIVFFISTLLISNNVYSFPPLHSSTREEVSINMKNGDSVLANNSAMGSSINIDSSGNGVGINVKNAFLIDVLEKLESKTNIQFRAASQLNSQIINANIHAEDWHSLVDILLQDFSKLVVWGNGSRIKNIFLLGGNESIPHEKYEVGIQTRHREKQDLELPISKLTKLFHTPTSISFPTHLYADPEIRRYLELAGIHSPDDWGKPKKARVVLHNVRRQLSSQLVKQGLN